MNKIYDVIIIGKGPAGISASLYTSRAGLKTLILGRESNLSKSHLVDNYYGFEGGISGPELLGKGESQTKRFGTEILEEEVIALEYDFEGTFNIRTVEGSYSSRSVLLATGSQKARIPVKNLERFEGKGIHYCTTCDGYFYKNRKVAILGYNEFAIYELHEMKQFTDNIAVLTNGNKIEADLVNVPVIDKKIASVEGDEYLERVVFTDGTYESFDGVFAAYGTASSIDFARKLGILIKDNIIEIDENQKTNLDGLYAAGDCASRIKQVAVSVGQGAVAGLKIAEYIRNMGR